MIDWQCFFPTTLEKPLFDWANYDDINLDVARYPGEYHIVDCRVNNSNIDVSLLQNDKERFPGNRILKIGQIFNITNLTIHDEGSYYCNASKRTDKSLGYLYMTPGKNNFAFLLFWRLCNDSWLPICTKAVKW